MSISQTILVTGCSSGMGRYISETLAREGYTVFATMRNTTGKNATAAAELSQLAQAEGLALHVLELDVTSDESVAQAVATAVQTVGRIDAVVNNAGTMAIGLSEALTVEKMQQMFDVNVLGAFRVNQAVLPHFRQQKAGYLFYISSSGGSVVYPFMGMYGATKAALNSIAEAWHYELYSLGIDTTIIQAGMYATQLVDNVYKTNAPELTEAYGTVGYIGQMTTDNFSPSVAAGGDPREVGQLIAELLQKPAGERPLFAPIGLYTEALGPLNQAHETFQGQVLPMMGYGSLLTR